MRKTTILKHYKRGLKKWEVDVSKDIKNKKDIRYSEKYWVECGFCKVHKECGPCPLYTHNSKGRLFCTSNGQNNPVSRLVLRRADNKKWSEAEKLRKQFIAKMKRVIKKVEA